MKLMCHGTIMKDIMILQDIPNIDGTVLICSSNVYQSPKMSDAVKPVEVQEEEKKEELVSENTLTAE